MQQNKIEQALRLFVKEELSPRQEDISFVANVYSSFTEVLGVNNCRQIGSFPRYTAIRPLHDLDIIYKIGEWNENNKNPISMLAEIEESLKREYKNPTKYKLSIRLQTHSISILFMDGEEEYFAVDVVPAMSRSINEFGDETFYVPEIINFKSRTKRQEFYNKLQETNQSMQWIKTDPLGYITVASNINKSNSDFRKSVKLLKGWKNNCKAQNDEFKLKSFHLEQLITEQVKKDKTQTVFQSIFNCLTNLKVAISKPSIRDRGDSTKFIDQYVTDLSESQIAIIEQATDSFLIKLEEFNGDVNELVNADFYVRNKSEQFLFDSKIPMLIDENLEFEIDGFIKNVPGYREYTARLSSSGGRVGKKNGIRFQIVKNNTSNDSRKWKIQNDRNCIEPRGEVGYDSEPVRIESTEYDGKHYAECYAIKNNICVARSRAEVII